MLERKVETDEEEKELTDMILAILSHNDKLIEIAKDLLSDEDAINNIPDALKKGVDIKEVLSSKNFLFGIADSIAKLHRYGTERASLAVVTITVLARVDSGLALGYISNIMERAFVFKFMGKFGNFLNALKK